MSNAGAHLIGATTYAAWAAHWPNTPGPFARPMNEIPKIVFSNSLTSADWDKTTIAAGDLTETVTRLKRERSGGYLLAHGGARFARSLAETGLIDEYRLAVHRVRASASSAHHSPSSRRAPPPSAAEPSPTSSQPTREQARSATGERTPLASL